LKPIAGFIKQGIKTTLTKFQDKVNIMCADDIGDEFDWAVSFEPTASLGNEDYDFLEYITPGSIVCPIYFLAVARTAEAFIAERSQGLLERSWVAGVLPLEILISFILSHLCVMCIQVFSSMLTVFVLLGQPCLGPVGWMVMLVIAQGFTGLCNGFFFSTVCTKASDAMLLSTVSTFICIFLCGTMWPTSCMLNEVVETLAWYLPQTATLEGIRDITLRGFGFEAQSVRHGLALSAAWSAMFFTASWALVNRQL